MFAKPDRVRQRRIVRRLKASASLVVAFAAGTFLACQRRVEAVKQVLDATRGAPGATATGDPPAAPGTGPGDASVEATDAALAVADATSDALVKRAADPRDAAVDVHRHRKGMPVPDNLLE